MIVDKIDVRRVTFVEAENDAPVGADRDCPESLEFALQGVQPESWLAHVLNAVCRVKKGEDRSNAGCHFRRQPTLVVVVEELPQALVAKTSDHAEL